MCGTAYEFLVTTPRGIHINSDLFARNARYGLAIPQISENLFVTERRGISRQQRPEPKGPASSRS
jgi:hypothetical protein